MSDQQVNQTEEVQLAPEEEQKFKGWLKKTYGIEDEPARFKETFEQGRRAAEELPKYHATLESLIRAAQEAEAESTRQVVQSGDPRQDAEDAKMPLLFRADPYEGTKRLLQRTEESLDQKLQQVEQRAYIRAEQATMARDTSQKAMAYVRAAWPEAFDRTSNLHKLGKMIYDREMSNDEKNDPRSFLIATERAAGRMGLPPVGRRQSSSSSEDSSEQGVSRQSRRPNQSGDNMKLSAPQKKYADLMKVSHKTYALMKKNREDQKTRRDED